MRPLNALDRLPSEQKWVLIHGDDEAKAFPDTWGALQRVGLVDERYRQTKLGKIIRDRLIAENFGDPNSDGRS